MTLDTLQSTMISAMKNKDKSRKAVISGMIDAVKKAAIDKNCRDNVPENLVDEVLLKYKKMVQEMIDTCPAERTETLKDYQNQMAVVTEFAPTLITDEAQVREMVMKIANENNITLEKKNRGVLMKNISGCLKGKVDMGVVNKVVGGVLQ